MRHYLKISAFDCGFFLYVNDIPCVDMRRSGNVNTTIMLNKFLINKKNEFKCLIKPAIGQEALTQTTSVKATIFTAIDPNGEKTILKEIATPKFEMTEENPIPPDYSLIDIFFTENIPDSLIKSGLTILDTPDFSLKLMDKYDEIWRYFKNNEMDKIKAFFRTRDQELDLLFNNNSGEQAKETVEDYSNYLMNSGLELWQMKKEIMVFKVYFNGQLACYELKNRNSPLCFVNNIENYTVYIPMYFQFNAITKSFIVIR